MRDGKGEEDIREVQDRFIDAIHGQIDYFTLEYKITAIDIIGALDVVKTDVYHASLKLDSEDNDG